MCIAIANMKGELPFEYFDNSDINNPDGMGMLYINPDKGLEAHWTVNGVRKFYEKYQQVRAASELPILIHFRYATHGLVNKANCHPFFVHDRLGFIHNGIIPGMGNNKKKSDTCLFNENVLQCLSPDFHRNPDAMSLIAHITGNSKLVFMDDTGHVAIVGEKQGHWFEDNWYSNYGYCYGNSRYTGCYAKGGNNAGGGCSYGLAGLTEEEYNLLQQGYSRGWHNAPPKPGHDDYTDYVDWYWLNSEMDEDPDSMRDLFTDLTERSNMQSEDEADMMLRCWAEDNRPTMG